MRLIIILITAGFLHVSAVGFAQKITLNEKNAKLTEVIKQIRIQSGYQFVYRNDLLENTANITIHLKGHSFGGVQTNEVIANSASFAAACSASGVANWTSWRGGVNTDGAGLQGMIEVGQSRAGSSLWESPDEYIENSPIFKAHLINTPLLMLTTTEDRVCPYTDQVAFFNALRRLGKKAWMLEYAGENHSLTNDINHAKDFTIRMQQFFDYYLKGAPAPEWMIKGEDVVNQKNNYGLSLNKTGQNPGPNLLTPEEQQKVNALRNRKPITVTLP